MSKGILTRLRVKRVALVDAGANFDQKTGDGAHIMLWKHATRKDGPSLSSVHSDSPDWDITDQDDYEKATLSGDARRGLPDSAFAAVWTDAQGKKHRKLPIHDAGHLAAARGRVDEAQIPAHVKAEARHKIEAATNRAHKEKSVPKTALGKLLAKLAGVASETDPTKRQAIVDEVIKDADGLPPAAPGIPGDNNNRLGEDQTMKALHQHLGSAIAAYGDGPHPDDHPVHAMKALHEHLGKMMGCEGTDSIGKGAPKMDAAVEKRIADIEKQNKDLRDQLAIEKGVRQVTEVTTILKGFKHVPLKLEGEGNDIARFVKMRNDDPDAFNRQMEIYRGIEAQLAMNASINKTLGSGAAGGNADAWDKIVAKAESLLEKSSGKMTREQAIEKVMLENPKLVAEYRASQN